MGLISRVSSRTYRKQRPKNQKKSPIMVCVKDVNQSDFVVAFAAFLKKSGKMTVPNGPTTPRPLATSNSRQPTTTGFTSELLLSPDNCTSRVLWVPDEWPPSTEVPPTEDSDHPTPEKVTDISLDSLSNNSKP